MKIAILGGGFTGLTAAFYLNKKGHDVTIIEREESLGGLAAGFKAEGWDWTLERAYHHIFSSDSDILQFADDTDFQDIFFTEPQTSSLYKYNGQLDNELAIFPLDTPVDLLKFPIIPFFDRLRAGAALGALKLSPFLPLYESMSASELLTKTMGKRAYEALFAPLMRRKFGKYAENILSVFIWARIKKRTKKLGYVENGFQGFVNYVEELLKDNGVTIQKGRGVQSIKAIDNTFVVETQGKTEKVEEPVVYDKVISTLPTPVIAKIGADILPAEYIANLQKMNYLNAACLIVESTQKVVEKAYWLSVCVEEMPMMVIVQHTNMISPEHYGGKHITYIANYIDNDHELLKMNGDEALEYYLPSLEALNPVFKESITRTFYFKAPFAQPIFDKEFPKIKPEYITPVEGFYMANLDMTYPYDRGTNYAVKLGREVAEIVSR